MFYHCHTFYVLFRFFYDLYCSVKPRIYFSYQFSNQRNQTSKQQIGIQFYGRKKFIRKFVSWQNMTRGSEQNMKFNETKYFLKISLLNKMKILVFAIFFFVDLIETENTNWWDKIKWSFFILIKPIRRKSNLLIALSLVKVLLKLILIDIIIKEKWIKT